MGEAYCVVGGRKTRQQGTLELMPMAMSRMGR